MTASRRLLPAVLAALVLAVPAVAGCSADISDTMVQTPDGMVADSHSDGFMTLARPTTWEPAADAVFKDRVASYVIRDGNRVVGQMDVFVNELGTDRGGAELLAEQTMAEEMFAFRNRRTVNREPLTVPGAESGYLVESSYETTGGDPARYLQLWAVTKDRRYTIVKITGAQDAYDATLWRTVLDTVAVAG